MSFKFALKSIAIVSDCSTRVTKNSMHNFEGRCVLPLKETGGMLLMKRKPRRLPVVMTICLCFQTLASLLDCCDFIWCSIRPRSAILCCLEDSTTSVHHLADTDPKLRTDSNICDLQS
eukprot:2984810-Amphidinium_carterae.1